MESAPGLLGLPLLFLPSNCGSDGLETSCVAQLLEVLCKVLTVVSIHDTGVDFISSVLDDVAARLQRTDELQY